MSFKYQLPYVFLVFYAALCLGTVFGSEEEALPIDGLREQCRKDVAGELINYFDLAKNELGHHQQVSRELKRSEVSLANAQKEKTRLEKKKLAQRGEFSIEAAEAMDRIDSKISAIQATLAEQKISMKSSHESYTSAESSYKKLSGSIEPVFQMKKMTQEGTRVNYLDLSYQGKCPKFRSQCPLAEKEKLYLTKNIIPLLSNKTNCQRYSQIR